MECESINGFGKLDGVWQVRWKVENASFQHCMHIESKLHRRGFVLNLKWMKSFTNSFLTYDNQSINQNLKHDAKSRPPGCVQVISRSGATIL